MNPLRNPKIQRLLVALLLAGSLLTLLLPWMTFRVGGTTLEKLQERAATAAETPEEVFGGISVSFLRRSDLGAGVELLFKGRISPVQQAIGLAKTAQSIRSAGGMALLGFQSLSDMLKEDENSFVVLFQRLLGWLNNQLRFTCALYWLAMILMAALLALALWSFFKGKRLGLIPYATSVLVAVGGLMIRVIRINGLVNIYGDFAMTLPELREPLIRLGVLRLHNLFGVGIGAWLCLLLTVGGIILSLIRVRSPREQALADWWAPARPARAAAVPLPKTVQEPASVPRKPAEPEILAGPEPFPAPPKETDLTAPAEEQPVPENETPDAEEDEGKDEQP